MPIEFLHKVPPVVGQGRRKRRPARVNAKQAADRARARRRFSFAFGLRRPADEEEAKAAVASRRSIRWLDSDI